MMRHACGYFLVNRGYNTREIQDFLGHRDIKHTEIDLFVGKFASFGTF
jgi:type 1 fimbriae regulatory protein FimB/type 1 fimbriae regulatory protein FimE